jgi:hypothetical protein
MAVGFFMGSPVLAVIRAQKGVGCGEPSREATGDYIVLTRRVYQLTNVYFLTIESKLG